MLILEQEAEKVVRGYEHRECIFKRVYWKEQGAFFVYQSSVPDEIHPDQVDCRDDAYRYDLIH